MSVFDNRYGEMAAILGDIQATTATNGTNPAPDITYESLERAVAEIDPDGRMLAEVALCAELRKQPVEYTKFLIQLAQQANREQAFAHPVRHRGFREGS